MDDKTLINRTLRLAAKARGMTSPNPMVGAILVKNNRIIAEDYHRMPGTPHAEALVTARVGDKAKGSTLYVSLEPCCHTDKRTPPCTKAIIDAGIKKVVIAMKDPNLKVSGRGILELEKAGIKVISGILEDKAKKLNEAYIKYITTKKPFVILKIAMTLDGKIATPEGQSKWITGEASRKIVHKLRSSVDAIMTAIGTVKSDDPELTVRLEGAMTKGQRLSYPLRIVIDPNLDIPINSRILKTPPDTYIVARETSDSSKLNYLLDTGIKAILFKDKLELRWLMQKLGEMDITSLMIEGGSSLNSHALEDGIVDKVMLFIAPKIIGGRDSYPAVGGKNFKRLDDAYKLKDVSLKKVGDDILIEGYL